MTVSQHQSPVLQSPLCLLGVPHPKGCLGLFSPAGCVVVHPEAAWGLSKPKLTASLAVSWQAVLKRDLSVPIRVPTLQLQEDSLSFLLPSALPSHGLQTTPTAQLLPGGSLCQDLGGYCANGFRPEQHEGRSPSCTFTQLGHALGSQVSLQPEKGEETHDEDGQLERAVPVGLTRDSSTGDRDYQTSQVWLSLHLQLYSKWQCPALGSGSCPPLPALGRSLRQEDLQESLGMAGHCIPLSSVRLPASEEADRGQLTHAPQRDRGTALRPGHSTERQQDSEPAAPGTSSPCQLPTNSPRAAAFSGCEPRVPADWEP